MTRDEIIKKIEKRMLELDVTAYGISKKSNNEILQETVRNLLAPNSNPTLRTLIDICNALGIEIIVKYKTN